MIRYISIAMIIIVLLCVIESLTSQTKSDTATGKNNKDRENDVLKKIADDNTVQINSLIEQIPAKSIEPIVIVKPKIVYVKVYEKAPEKRYSKDYIPIELAKLYANKIDSLLTSPAPLDLPHKRTFLQRVFNTNK